MRYGRWGKVTRRFHTVFIVLLLTFVTGAWTHDTPGPAQVSVVSRDWEQWIGTDGWWAYNNVWNHGSLVNGVNYTQTITVDKNHFPNNTVIAWSWPNTPAQNNVYGYPEITYGAMGGNPPNPVGLGGPSPTKISALNNLTASFNLSIGGGNLDNFSVLLETFLTNAPNDGATGAFEFGIFLHSPSYETGYILGQSPLYHYNAAGLTATIAVKAGSPPFIQVLPSSEILSGTIDLKSIFNFLIAKKVITGNEYLNGLYVGVEPQKKSGTLTINSLNYTWN